MNQIVCPMVCTDCGYVGESTTLIEGSDLLELFGWCLFALPGLFYCAWRHYVRSKACRLCGSTELMREARATTAQRPPRTVATDRLVESVSSGSVAWPKHLATPRERFRRCLIPTLAMTSVAMVAAFSGGEVAVAFAASAYGVLIGVCPLGQLALHIVSPSRSKRTYSAWDRDGRVLSIEQI